MKDVFILNFLNIYAVTLSEKKSTQAVTGAVPFQKVNFGQF